MEILSTSEICVEFYRLLFADDRKLLFRRKRIFDKIDGKAVFCRRQKAVVNPTLQSDSVGERINGRKTAFWPCSDSLLSEPDFK
jgi:hypothetical protein